MHKPSSATLSRAGDHLHAQHIWFIWHKSGVRRPHLWFECHMLFVFSPRVLKDRYTKIPLISCHMSRADLLQLFGARIVANAVTWFLNLVLEIVRLGVLAIAVRDAKRKSLVIRKPRRCDSIAVYKGAQITDRPRLLARFDSAHLCRTKLT